MWALMGEGGGMKYCTWDGDGGLVLLRAKDGRKSMGTSSCPTCKAHTTGSDLAERCDIMLSCTSLLIPWKWIIVTCVYFPSLFYMLVWPGFAQYSLESLTVLDNTLRFNYRHYVFSAEHGKTFKPTFPLQVVETHSTVSYTYIGITLWCCLQMLNPQPVKDSNMQFWCEMGNRACES